MPLWARVGVQPETWPELEMSATERFWDGVTLACGEGRGTGAIYLWGYVGEMLLKSACLRIRRVPAGEDIGPRLHHEGLRHHRLQDLLVDLRTIRAADHRPLDPLTGDGLVNHVDILSQNWSVDLRYRASLASPEEVEEVYRAVDWLVDRYARLV